MPSHGTDPGQAHSAEQRHAGWPGYLGLTDIRGRAGPLVLLPYRERHLNAPGGVIHGGIVSTMMHEAALQVASEGFGAPARAVDGQASFLRGARQTDLTATAAVARQGRAFAFVNTAVYDEQYRAVATGVWALTTIDESHPAGPVGEPEAPVEPADGELSEIAATVDANMAERVPGLRVHATAPGRCVLLLANTGDSHDGDGRLAPGLQMLAADNAGVFAGFELAGAPGAGATVDLKLSFCEPVEEAAYVRARCRHRAGRLVFTELAVHGTETGRLKAFGSATFLI